MESQGSVVERRFSVVRMKIYPGFSDSMPKFPKMSQQSVAGSDDHLLRAMALKNLRDLPMAFKLHLPRSSVRTRFLHQRKSGIPWG
jgi:hypothetical protein